MGKRLQSWKGKLLNRAGRLKLVNSVLTSIPTYYLTIFRLQKWALKKMDKLRRSFLWKGAADANGGHCLVNWSKTKRPKAFEGLGILDLDLFSRTLRLSHLRGHGLVLNLQSMKWTDNYSEQALRSQLGMGPKQASGNLHGCKAKRLWMFFLIFSS